MKQIYRQRQSARPAPPAGGPTSGPLTPEELQLAARNHSMPLEALRRDITPPGLHYVLTHFDIPDIDESSWHLRITGAVDMALELSMAALRKDPAITVPVTLSPGSHRLEFRSLDPPTSPRAINPASSDDRALAHQ